MTLRGENRPKTDPIFEKGPNVDPNFEHWLKSEGHLGMMADWIDGR